MQSCYYDNVSRSYKSPQILTISGDNFLETLRSFLANNITCKIRAQGFSMTPFIRDKDVLTISPLSDHSVKKGDIVAAIHPETNKFIVHRIIEKTDNGYILRGDNSTNIDGIIAPQNIFGYVQKIERNGKNIFLGLDPERSFIPFLTTTWAFQKSRRIISWILQKLHF